jgi:hypothetical protein
MPEKPLSSSVTFFGKFIWTGLLIACSACFVLILPWRLQSLPCAALVVMFALGACFRLFTVKRVVATDDGLVVSNYFRTILVPYKDVVAVKEIHWPSGKYVRLLLSQPCRFGRKIEFLPRGLPRRWFWREHQITEWLRERCNLKRAGP